MRRREDETRKRFLQGASVRLNEVIRMKSENLQLTRFFAAIFVIVAHAYVLCTASNAGDWLIRLTNGQLTMGYIAVSVFFFCSGLLIAKSVKRKGKFIPYIKARAIKIFPSLCFTIVLLMIAGGFISELGMRSYWAQKKTWRYLLNCCLILQHDLPGVFTHAPYVSTVNGALWTLPVEFLCYIGCFIFYRAGFMKKRRCLISIPAVVLFVFIIYYLAAENPILLSAVNACFFFYIGMIYYVYRENIVLKWQYACAAGAGLVVSSMVRMAVVGLYLFFPYLLLVLWYGIRQISSRIASLGNYSYGMYLWGFPIQQAVIYLHGNQMSPVRNILLSLPISIMMGALTYYLCEKPLSAK